MPQAIVQPAFPFQSTCEDSSWSHVLFRYGHGAHGLVGDTLFAITAFASTAAICRRDLRARVIGLGEKKRMTYKELAKFHL